MTGTPAIDLDALLRRLHLPTVRRLYPDLATRAEGEAMAYREYLAILMAEEVAHRAQTRIQRCVRRARFPFLKTIDEYDFTFQSAVRLSLLGSALGPEFVTGGHSLILSGPSGTGKTHLAVAVAYRAIQNGFDAAFTTATALIADLSLASRRGRLRHTLTTYTHPHVLVIDEVGYLTYGPDAAHVLFQVVNDRYLHQRPMIFTTNKPLAAWGRVLHDPDLAEAILDRVLERGRHIELRGRSYRTRHAPLDLTPSPEAPSPGPARISGNHPPEFPEPAEGESAVERRLTAAAVNRPLALLRHLLRLAHEEWEAIENVPRIRLEKEPQGRLRWLTQEEITRLLDAAAKSRNKELGAAVIVALNTGLRRGEILGLTWERVDLSRCVIRLELTKSGRRREVPMNDDSYRALVGLGPKAEGRVFKTRYIQTAYNNAVAAAKLDDVNFHTLRHTFASWAVMRGVTLKELQELLGHASLAMTMRYAHLAPEHLRTAVSRLEGLASSQPASVSAQASAQEPVETVGASQK